MASKKINYTALDFDSQKSGLKEFLQGQDVFSDYDFDGSGLSVLLDILTYNTHYNAIYNNLSINEMFLDSARKRNSVVSISKELGYMPKSATCARATVNITFTRTGTAPMAVAAWSPFTTSVNGVSYTFYNSSALYYVGSALTYTFTGVELIEKTNQLVSKYTVASGVQYIIPNPYADLSTVTVTVQESVGSSNVTTYSLADNIVNVESLSNAYWVKEIDNGLYELTFGNGIIGTALSNGNIVIINYSVSSLDAPNGAKLFSYSGTLPTGVTAPPVITTTSKASGGSNSEDIESIRFNAPRAYSAQNRGVTANDYAALIYSNFPEAHSVSVWGGEDNTPPIYGKTFISIKPQSGELLTTYQKDYILNTILPNKNVLTVIPEIVDATYIGIVVKTTVYYNELNTIRTSNDIKTIVTDTILNYDATELQRFDGIFRYSKVSKLIDESEESIVNNITTVTLKRAIDPKYNIIAEYSVDLINPIYYSGAKEDIVLSSGFYIAENSYVNYLTDDGLGNMQLFYIDSSNVRITINTNIGTVDYAKGLIKFKNLKITSVVGDTLYLYVKPSSNDVVSALTQIVQVSKDDLVVSVISDKSASGDLRGGKNYTITTSRI